MLSIEFTIEAVLFDLDGVLIDSTAAVEYIWRAWGSMRGLDVEDIIPISHGRRIVDVVGELVPSTQVAEELRRIQALELKVLDPLVEIEGARRFLSSLKVTPWAVVTSGARVVAEARLGKVGLPRPEVIVTAEDVFHGKPDPEPFLIAAALLGIEPAVCIAFEDAPLGITSAKRAGARVVALPTTHRRDFLHEADAIIENFSYISAKRGERGTHLTVSPNRMFQS